MEADVLFSPAASSVYVIIVDAECIISVGSLSWKEDL